MVRQIDLNVSLRNDQFHSMEQIYVNNIAMPSCLLTEKSADLESRILQSEKKNGALVSLLSARRSKKSPTSCTRRSIRLDSIHALCRAARTLFRGTIPECILASTDRRCVKTAVDH